MARIAKIVGCAALCFDLVVASAASGPCLSGSDSDNCVSRPGDEAAMLQAKVKARGGGRQAPQAKCPGTGTACAGDQCCPRAWISNHKTFPCPSADPDYKSCEIDTLPEAVHCPYSEGTWCRRNQCCPGTAESDGLTFPCPNADADFDGCEASGLLSPGGSLLQMEQAAHKATCPGSGNECSGNQCCPGVWISNNLSFPCPSANRNFGGCQIKELPESVNCPFGDNMCSGNQCCPGVDESNGLTFPCPNADADFDGCQASGLWQGGSLPEVCPGSGTKCAGNQCCPGAWISNNLTFPCPSADADYDKCQIDELPGAVKCPYSGSRCNGNQCCPGVTGSGDLTFPCPNADPDFDGCQTSGLWGR
mmetsp:Transcript_7433/g.21119  ORF Transcript_7433/g.21119 Transcript_7433/m.21119 type:complete len:363 (+) Transcript_7433:78-1166(+)